MNLTAMLVMTTIFISKMEGLPSTAYMKMIDIWLILCQLVPFVEVVLFTAKEYTRQDDEGEVLQNRGPGLKHLHKSVGFSRASLVLRFIGKFKTEKMQTKKSRTHIPIPANWSDKKCLPRKHGATHCSHGDHNLFWTCDLLLSSMRRQYLTEGHIVCNKKTKTKATHTYGSVSAGREKWPFNVLFFLKVELLCDQT